MTYGARMIAESRLEAVPNDTPDRDYEIDFTIPEFTCLAPDSGFPDFATIRIRYIPDQKLVELKSLKLYINKFRDQEIFHEAAVNRILDDLLALLDPRFMEVVGDFNVRGNIKTVVTARHTQTGYSPNGASRAQP
ncbi:MAG TPA: preQ(1) synthase [Candidatus Dormibacteraeota bacterium]|nr:preQ(1) synthase [Candidatus Dormibacteraeota bacterium]